MGLILIPKRTDNITRQVVIDKIGHMLSVEREDETVEAAGTVTCSTEDGTCFLNFVRDRLASVEIFSVSYNGDSVNHVEAALGVLFVSEHDDEFDYHDFCVDINVDPPHIGGGGWAWYLDGTVLCPVHVATKRFYTHMAVNVDSFDLHAEIAALNQELA